MAKSYRITLCQHGYQLSSVTLFVLFFLILATLRNFSTVQNQSHRSGNTDRSGGAIRWPVQITHLLNFSTVIVLLNTDVALQLLSVVVNNSKNWHCLQSGKMKAENTPSASSSYLVKKIEIERTTLICGHFSSINTFVSSIIIGGAEPPPPSPPAPPLATALTWLNLKCVVYLCLVPISTSFFDHFLELFEMISLL